MVILVHHFDGKETTIKNVVSCHEEYSDKSGEFQVRYVFKDNHGRLRVGRIEGTLISADNS